MRLAEIDRDLRNESPKIRYHIARLQEELTELQRQHRYMTELLVKVVDALNDLRVVNLKLNQRWEKRLRGDPDFDLVRSVLPEPEDI